MIEGIAMSEYFILIATRGYFEKQWPIYELLTAQILRKPLIVLLECDKRYGGWTFEEFKNLVPKPWRYLLNHEILKIERRGKFWEATISELTERLIKRRNWAAEEESK